MKTYKSGKQRRAEIKAARLSKQHRASHRVDGFRVRPEGTEPVNPARLRPNNSYGVPDFVWRGYYKDMAFRCVDCGVEQVWTAQRQRWWYEVAQGDVYSTARRCAPCRLKERQRKEDARRAWREGLERKAARQLRPGWAGMAPKNLDR
ncbi:MAG: zinc-ribbon domain containing protein [Pseudomonadota bacterium]